MFECICVSVLLLSICNAIPSYKFQMAQDDPNIPAIDINGKNYILSLTFQILSNRIKCLSSQNSFVQANYI